MNKYIKPTFTFASLAASVSSSGGCGISKEEKNELIDIYGDEAFTIDGKCNVPVEGFCEFTSVEYENPIKAFGS